MGRPPAREVGPMTKLRYHLLGRGPMWRVAYAAQINPTVLSHYSYGWKEIAPQHLMSLAEVLDLEPDQLIGLMEDEWLETES